MILTDFENRIQVTMKLNDRDSKRMDRSINDIASLTGMRAQEVLDFIIFGAEGELKSLHESYDWEVFRKKIVLRLRPQRQGEG
ncbi:MAG: hypothetical protein K8R21_05470 [Leptospira sp.]|nr:hypothetical protein [Leptospira sp.]